MGHEVVRTECPSEALRELERGAPALCMMDLRFPNATGQPDSREGRALIRRIREAGDRLPVVVLSGWPADLYGEPEEAMVSRIMVKPVAIPELLETIAELTSASAPSRNLP
jgi:CheY-like chemotaxis protein